MFKKLLACAALVLSPSVHAQEVYGPTEEIKQERWEDVKPFAIASTFMHLADAYTTHECTKMWKRGGNCYETNSLYGSKHPSLKRIVMIKAPTIIGSWFIGREISRRNKGAGIAFFTMQTVVTSKVVLQNIRIVY